MPHFASSAAQDRPTVPVKDTKQSHPFSSQNKPLLIDVPLANAQPAHPDLPATVKLGVALSVKQSRGDSAHCIGLHDAASAHARHDHQAALLEDAGIRVEGVDVVLPSPHATGLDALEMREVLREHWTDAVGEV